MILLLILVSLQARGQKRINPNGYREIRIPVSAKNLDIPTYRETDSIPYVYWQYCKQKETQLGLNSPETGTDSLIFRVWMSNPIGKRNQIHRLVEISHDGDDWSGRLILMRVDFNKSKKTETVTESQIFELRPVVTDWPVIMDSLFFFGIDSLPTDDQIPGYYTDVTMYRNYDPTFSFEYSTPSKYRFFQYSNLYRAADRFWQPAHVVRILNILDREFHWYSMGREFLENK